MDITTSPPPPSNVYFVYGSLMDPSTLQSLIPTREPPFLTPATLSDYQIKMWGPYPAIVPSSPPHSVQGMVFEISSFEHANQIQQRLEEYEGPNYKFEECCVRVEGRGGSMVRAKTFEWIGGEEELKEGVFDLKDYQMKRVELRRGV